MERAGKTIGLSLLAGACLAVAAAGEYKVEKAPEWSAEGGMFGWACSEEGGPNQECAFVETASSGVAPAGEEAFAKRFTWRAEDEVEARKGRDRGVCKYYLTPVQPEGAREVMVARIQSNEMGGVSDALCTVSFSPDGTIVGVAAAWADFEGTQDGHARLYTVEQFESMYWSILALKIYRKHSEDAVTYFNHALALDPSNQRARYKLACTLVRQGETEEAIIQLAEAISLQPKKLRKKARKDKELKPLKKEEDFKILVQKEEGWKDIRGRLGTPAESALPPGLEELRKEIADRAAAEAAEAEEPPDVPEPVEPEPVDEGGAKQMVNGLLEKVGCSIGVVG
ncbi:MAG: tetratricopeptide repeat protein [Deltaproteobacteria bacterium]|nr:tetratricopeptide repeat protein [Deltaproteobacteria bacterium]